jgi:predicted nucleotidyltransferase
MVERTNIISELCRAQEIADWVLRARPALAEPASDVDIGVKPKRGKSFSVREKSEIAVALEDILLVHRIDLVVLPEADPFLAANIIRGERLFSHDANAADEYELYILRRAGDLAPLERERQSLIQARFAPSRLWVWNRFFRTAAMPGMARFASGHGRWVPGEA